MIIKKPRNIYRRKEFVIINASFDNKVVINWFTFNNSDLFNVFYPTFMTDISNQSIVKILILTKWNI